MDVTKVGPETFRLPRREREAHKGNFGRVLILAGSVGYTGAAVFAARGAVRAGAGLVFLAVPGEIYPIVAVKCDEAMPFPLPEAEEELLERAKGCDTVLSGPGLGQGERAEHLLLRLLREVERPLVLDADGLNLLSRHIDELDRRAAPTVLTPHEGEFQRLSGCALPLGDRLAQARAFVEAHPCVLVLKGAGTLTVSPERCFQNGSGNPGMAKGGSGDVLAGLLAGFLGQKQLSGRPLEELCALAVWVHGAAGDLCARRYGEYAMTPGDLLSALPEVLKALET